MASGGGAEEELPDEDVQGPPSGPEKPALQVQAVETELPSRESEFVGHSKHVSETWVSPPPHVQQYKPESGLRFLYEEHVKAL